jgi:hypothetical protein
MATSLTAMTLLVCQLGWVHVKGFASPILLREVSRAPKEGLPRGL